MRGRGKGKADTLVRKEKNDIIVSPSYVFPKERDVL